MSAGAYLRGKRLEFDAAAIAKIEADLALEVATARKHARRRSA